MSVHTVKAGKRDVIVTYPTRLPFLGRARSAIDFLLTDKNIRFSGFSELAR